MIKLNLVCYGYYNKNYTLFGVLLRSNMNEEIKKVFRLKDKTTLNCAELHAVEYALKSVKYPNEADITLTLSNTYIKNVLATKDDEYTLKPSSNIEFVKKVRDVHRNIPFIKVEVKKDGLVNELQEFVKAEAKRIENELAGNKEPRS